MNLSLLLNRASPLDPAYAADSVGGAVREVEYEAEIARCRDAVEKENPLPLFQMGNRERELSGGWPAVVPVMSAEEMVPCLT